MERREFLRLLASSAAAAGAYGCSPGERPAGDRPPNFVFVFADQLRTEAIGLYGGRNITTPHIDRMALEGIAFDNALSTCPVCSPYRGMLMTGRYPTHSGVLCNRINISPSQNPRCLAQLFEAAGYDTGYLGKWHLSAGIKEISGRLGGDEQAIARYKEQNPHFEFTPPGADRIGFTHWESYNYHTDFNDYWFYRDEPEKIFVEGYETQILIDQAIAFMEQRKSRNRPFLLIVAPHPPHPPFLPQYCPPGYLEQVAERIEFAPNVPRMSEEGRAKLTLLMRCYYAMIKNLDDGMGRLVDYLDRSNLAGDTLLAFSSDHGEMHGSHGLEGKMYPLNESVNVPLVMRWPGRIPAGLRSKALYTPMDHLPTFCSLAGIPLPQGVDGSDLSALLAGEAGPARDSVLMANYVAGYANFRTGRPRPEWRAVHTGRHTYVKWLTGQEALFDNIEDRYQLENLAESSQQQPTLERLRSRLSELLAESHDDFLPGTAYADWYDAERHLLRTALGPVPS